MSNVWDAILATARWYPSPHNSQPMRVRVIAADRAEIAHDPDRGLPAEPYGIPSGSASASFFLEWLAMAARFVALALIAALETVIGLLGRSHRTCALLIAPGFERIRWWLGRRRA